MLRGGEGAGFTLTFACCPNNFFGGCKVLNFAMFLVSSFFPNYFAGTYAKFSRCFFGFVNFHRNFGGASLFIFCFYGVSFIQVTIIFGFIDYSRFLLPIKSTRSSQIKPSGTRRARSTEVVAVV